MRNTIWNDLKIEELAKDKNIQQSLFEYALYFTKCPEGAQDLVQHARTRVWEHKENINLEKTPEAYLKTIIYHKFIDDNRKTKDFSFISMEEIKDVSLFNPGEVNLTLQEIKKIINNITVTKQRELTKLLIKWYEYKDIWEEMNISSSDVKVTVHRARKFIGKALLDSDPEYYKSRVKH